MKAITISNIQIGNKFKLSSGAICTIEDIVYEAKWDSTFVSTSFEGLSTNFEDRINTLVEFLNEENSIQI